MVSKLHPVDFDVEPGKLGEDVWHEMRLTAENWDAKAKYQLAGLFMLRKDCRRAEMMYYKAAKAGHVGSMYDLGMLLLNGYKDCLGVVQSNEYAYRWLAEAALAGHKKARKWCERAYGRRTSHQLLELWIRDAAAGDRNAAEEIDRYLLFGYWNSFDKN